MVLMSCSHESRTVELMQNQLDPLSFRYSVNIIILLTEVLTQPCSMSNTP